MFFDNNTFKHGVRIEGHKDLTSGRPMKVCPPPENIVLPLSMHIGAPAKPVVAVGDKVKMGQLVAQAQGFVSSNIHSSVSGVVQAMERRFLPSGALSECLVIANDGLDTLDETIEPRSTGLVLAPKEMRSLLQSKGIVGMGGATFPTHVKYTPPSDKPQVIDTVIINGIECEPYITADHRVLVEYAPEVIRGLKYFMKAVLATRGVIAIESNKPDAIALLQKLTEQEENITVVSCPEKYPQGSEKQLVYAVTGRVIANRALPASVGVVIDNVATAVWAARAIKDDMPCIERVVTLSGDGVQRPGNYLVRLGTSYEHVVKTCGGGIKEPLVKILSGGPMMGFAISNLDYPVLKGSGGVLLFAAGAPITTQGRERQCVRCGHCLDVCPMFLEPTVIAQAVKARNWSAALQANVASCIECGSCAYVCPAYIPLVQHIRMAKQFIASDGRGGHNPLYDIKD